MDKWKINNLISKPARAEKQSTLTFIKRGNIYSEALQEFKQMLPLVDWDSVTKLEHAYEAYNRDL